MYLMQPNTDADSDPTQGTTVCLEEGDIFLNQSLSQNPYNPIGVALYPSRTFPQ